MFETASLVKIKIFYVVLITSLGFVLSPSAGVFCAIVSHPADSVVSVLNKESGSSAIGVLKKLGPKGEYWILSRSATDKGGLSYCPF